MEMNGTVKITGGKIKNQMSINEVEVYNKERAENNRSSYVENNISPEIIMLNETYSQCEKHRTYPGQKGNSAAERAITGHLLGNNLRALSQTNMPLSTDVTDALKFVASEFKRITTHNTVFSAEKTSIPDADLWEMIADSINKIDENYMDVYESAVQVYMNFFSDFSDAISEMSKYITSHDDDNYPIEINYAGLYVLFNDLYEKYANTDSGILFASRSQDEAIQWATEWGLSSINYNSQTGMYEVRIDMSPIDNILDGIVALFSPGASREQMDQMMYDVFEYPPVEDFAKDNEYVNNVINNKDKRNDLEEDLGLDKINDLHFSSAEYQAFQAGFDAQEQVVQTTMQTMTQKYNTAVSLVDNLYKILSSTISSCTETLKAYLTN